MLINALIPVFFWNIDANRQHLQNMEAYSISIVSNVSENQSEKDNFLAEVLEHIDPIMTLTRNQSGGVRFPTSASNLSNDNC